MCPYAHFFRGLPKKRNYYLRSNGLFCRNVKREPALLHELPLILHIHSVQQLFQSHDLILRKGDPLAHAIVRVIPSADIVHGLALVPTDHIQLLRPSVSGLA